MRRGFERIANRPLDVESTHIVRDVQVQHLCEDFSKLRKYIYIYIYIRRMQRYTGAT